MDEALDEYGLPIEWRREEPEDDLSAEDEARLAPFREWCDSRGLRAFPAAPRTVYLFVTEGGVTGEQLNGIGALCPVSMSACTGTRMAIPFAFSSSEASRSTNVAT